MTTLKSFLLGTSLIFTATAFAACPYPTSPKDLPSGETEGKEDMMTAQKAVKAYVASMEEYLKCLDTEVAALGEGASEEQRLMRDKRYNAAVEQMDGVAGRFNQAVRTYKARQN
ncbi:MAG: hypothetical protein AB8G17_06195 [Gammaproteobacteria bacterium]